MMKTRQEKVNDLINRLHQGKHIDDMTTKWLLQTPNPPRVPIIYTLTKIHKSKPIGRPIISGCDGPVLNEYPHLWIHCSSLLHRNKNPLLRIQLISLVL